MKLIVCSDPLSVQVIYVMTYDPFVRGPSLAGVSSDIWHDVKTGRELSVEIWYPSSEPNEGQDLKADTQDQFVAPGLSGEPGSKAHQAAVRDVKKKPGELPMIVLVHGYAGHRRELTYLGTHLASHGFLVVAADHVGSTYADIDDLVNNARRDGRHFTRAEIMPALFAARRTDIPFLIDTATDRFDIHQECVGITGASLGGWTSLMAPSVDGRIKASAPMCPSGGESPTYPRGQNAARDALDFNWQADTATMFMVASHDSWLPLHGQIELFRRTPGSKRLFVLERADHNHFVDDIAVGHEWLRTFTASLADVETEGGTDWHCIAKGMLPYSELCSEHKAHACWRGLCVAHMDAHLRGNEDALVFLDVALQELSARDIDVVELSSG